MIIDSSEKLEFYIIFDNKCIIILKLASYNKEVNMDNLDSNFRKYKNYSKEDGNILNKSNLNNLN